MPFPTELTTPPVMKMNFGIYLRNRLDPRRQAGRGTDHLFGTHRMSAAKRVSTTLDGNRGLRGPPVCWAVRRESRTRSARSAAGDVDQEFHLVAVDEGGVALGLGVVNNDGDRFLVLR